MLAGLIQSEGQSCRRGLIDDANHIQPGYGSGILCGLPLIVIEVSRDGDHRLVHAVCQVCLRIGLDLAQDLGGDILRAVLLAVNPDLVVSAHLPLDAGDSSFRIGDRLPLGRLSHQRLSLFGEGHIRRKGLAAYARTLCTGNNSRSAADQNCSRRIAGSKVDADNF